MSHQPEHPTDSEIGYVYDSIRQQQNRQIEQVEKAKKLKKKMDKLSRNRYAKFRR